MIEPRLAIEYLGHATLLVELDGIRFLTDPALRDRIGPLTRIGPSIEHRQPNGVDAILVSHLHHDHLDLPSLDRVGAGARIVAPAGAGAWLRARGVGAVTELGAGDAISIGGVRVRAVPARHSGGRPFGTRDSAAVGYLIEGSSPVYFAGDTGFFRGLADLARAVDVALLPVGGWGPTLHPSEHLDPVAAARAAALIRPRVAVPIHWGTYWPSGFGWFRRGRQTEPATEFARAAAELAPTTRVRPTAIGETVELA